MKTEKRTLFLFYIVSVFFFNTDLSAQNIEAGVKNIRSAKLYKSGDQTSFPVLNLGSSDVLELHFDDLDGNIKNYYYTFQLCNADWSPSSLTSFEYIKGFQQVRITNYRSSSLSNTRYTHYQAPVPDRNAYPGRSGNYLLKVFLNGDTTQTVFTKRFVVVSSKASVAAQLQQPYHSQYFRSHQKVQVAVTTDNRTQVFSPQDIKVVVLQNNNWQTAIRLERPTVYRGNYFEYSDEAITAMPAGKEWRWIDLRSYRLKSDRMEAIDARRDTPNVRVKQDASRNGQVYVYYRDLNGSYTIETMESINPFWQSEYGLVTFTYVPPVGRNLEGQDVVLFGELTNYGASPEALMEYIGDKGVYEKTLFLKQGFYSYTYVTLPKGKNGYPDFSITEGNYWGTENAYTVLVYHRPFGARADELIGYGALNSAFQRNGF